jgi:rfaE bifunctional protein kinase chain/domain
LLRIDSEDTHDLTSDEQQLLLGQIRQILDTQEVHAILFQDYNKGVLSYPVISSILLEAIKRDIPTAVDPKDKNFWAYKHVTLFKPNLKEIRQQLPGPIHPSEASLRQTARAIFQKLENQITLITLSDKGLYINNQQQDLLVDTLPRQIADVCGAGDTVISVATLAMAAGADIATIATLSNMAGGQVCEKVGVVPVNREQLHQECLKYFALG